MYQEYFGLTEKPFSETPDPEFLYLSTRHREGLAHLEYNILDGKGFSVLIGEVGVGKTTLCRALFDRLDAGKVTLVHIIHTNLDFYEFLREVVEELGIVPQGQQKWDLLKALNHYLIEAYAQNRKVVLIVDEAQNLEPSVLEGIRMLSNLETPHDKLIQIVFVGQPGLAGNIQRPDMLQLKQRIAGSFYLGPLTRKETHEYILFRLNRVQTKPALRFTTEAMDLIYQFSNGVPRLINFLCDFSLTHAYVAETWTVDQFLVRKAYKEVEGFRFRGEPIEEKERRFQGKLRETGQREGEISVVKRLPVKAALGDAGLEQGATPEEEIHIPPGEKWRRKTIVVALGLALTFAGLSSLVAYREWGRGPWSPEAAAPAYIIKIPLSDPEEEILPESHLQGKQLSKVTFELKALESSPSGTLR